MSPAFSPIIVVSFFIITTTLLLFASSLDALQCTAFLRTHTRRYDESGAPFYRSSWQAPDVLFLQKTTTADNLACGLYVQAQEFRYNLSRRLDWDNLRVIATFIPDYKCTLPNGAPLRDSCHYVRTEFLRTLTSKEAKCCCFTDHCNDLRSDRFAFNIAAIRDSTTLDLGEIVEDNRRALNVTFEDAYQQEYERAVLEF